MLSLIVPWVMVLLLVLECFFLFKKRWIVAIILFVAISSINLSFKCFAFPFWFNDSNLKHSVSVMIYNIDGMNGNIREKASQIAGQIIKSNPDVVFITEYCEQDVLALDTLLKKHYSYSTENLHNEGSYFYSKYPLSLASRLRNPISGKDFGIFICNTYIDNDTLCFIGCHFASNNYDENLNRQALESISNHEGVISYIKNIGIAGEQRAHEANAIAKKVSEVSQKTILLGDLNDICGSKTLRILENAGLKDAWWEGGFGYGATIFFPLPYRIDHIMHNVSNMVLKSISVIDSEGLSDHHALYAELEF